VAAHPDDETIGASLVLTRAPAVHVLHLTDGAPRDAGLWPAGNWTRESYRAARRDELGRALDVAGIAPDRRLALGLPDQECSTALPLVIRELIAVVAELGSEVILTHAYEGGHPDHDAAAFAAATAAALLARSGRPAPAVWEMALYHGGPGRLVTSEFLSGPSEAADAPQETAAWLSPAQRVTKQRMLECFTSQRELLRQFPSDVERFRPAPRYDFTCPPHLGPLWYEQLGWPLTGERWRELARAAAGELRSEASR
jgi:LmbE family N-acetylglucosaminyl deacetylase